MSSHLRWSLALLATGCAAGTPPPPTLRRATESVATPGPPSRPAPILPCAEASAERHVATIKWLAMSLAMRERRATAFEEVVTGIDELVASPCYRWTDYEPPVHLQFDAPEALAAWWDAGGRTWLGDYLHLPSGRSLADTIGFSVSIAPDARRVLNARAVADPDASPGRRALAWMVCPEGEADCGQATAGWALRAESAFQRFADRRALFSAQTAQEAYERADAAGAQPCRAQALAAEPVERYRVYRACIQRAEPLRTALPLGRFRAPASGWLIVGGRRGHYELCDGLSAYDLTTGSAYEARSCSGLEFGAGGVVDHAAVDARRRVTLTTGTLPIDNLRELAFVMLLAPEGERNLVTKVSEFHVPSGIEAVFSSGPRLERGATSQVRTSADTVLKWALVREGVATNHGAVTWPWSWSDTDTYVDELLAIAEAGLVRGCPPAALPKTLPLAGAFGPVSFVDASVQSLDATSAALILALRTEKSPATCKR